MTREEAEILSNITSKYGIALTMLYPNQNKLLQDAIAYWNETEQIPEISDAFVRFAFLMIISDFLYQNRE